MKTKALKILISTFYCKSEDNILVSYCVNISPGWTMRVFWLFLSTTFMSVFIYDCSSSISMRELLARLRARASRRSSALSALSDSDLSSRHSMISYVSSADITGSSVSRSGMVSSNRVSQKLENNNNIALYSNFTFDKIINEN